MGRAGLLPLAEKLGREREITTSFGKDASFFAYAPAGPIEGGAARG